jgi:hypothetical protein
MTTLLVVRFLLSELGNAKDTFLKIIISKLSFDKLSRYFLSVHEINKSFLIYIKESHFLEVRVRYIVPHSIVIFWVFPSSLNQNNISTFLFHDVFLKKKKKKKRKRNERRT